MKKENGLHPHFDAVLKMMSYPFFNINVLCDLLMCILLLDNYILNASLVINGKGKSRVPVVATSNRTIFLHTKSGGPEWEQTSSPVHVQN